MLLDSGSTPVTRKAAAEQIGEVQKLHPHELQNLLKKVIGLNSIPIAFPHATFFFAVSFACICREHAAGEYGGCSRTSHYKLDIFFSFQNDCDLFWRRFVCISAARAGRRE